MSAAEAQNLLKQGRLLEAEKAFERLLETSPEHTEALNVLALSAMREGNVRRAVELLRRAAAGAPLDALTQHHLARALDADGDAASALSAHASAVRLRPDFSVARLFWGDALQRNGHVARAVVQYMRALQDAQRAGRWVNPQTTPPALQPLVEQAVRTVRAERNAACAGMLEPLIAKFGAAALERVAQGLRIYFKQETAAYSDPRQRPTYFFMPGLPPAPYPDRALFPWADAFDDLAPAIRRELDVLLPHAQGSERVFDSAALERENLRGTGGEPGWTGYYFFRHGERRDDNGARCPVTARALEALPLSRVPGHGPEVLFSVFTPGTHLMPHRGVTNTRLVGHLPLLVPADCALKVGGELHAWEFGKTIVFDDTYEHEAWNRSGETRVVLIFDLWNPHLTETERLAVADIVRETGEFRESVESA